MIIIIITSKIIRSPGFPSKQFYDGQCMRGQAGLFLLFSLKIIFKFPLPKLKIKYKYKELSACSPTYNAEIVLFHSQLPHKHVVKNK